MKVIAILFILSAIQQYLIGAELPSKATNTSNRDAILTNQTNAIPLSVFTVPANSQQGRDPFFPTSTRISTQLEKTNAPQETVQSSITLNLQGISGTAENKLAIINGRTLAQNEEVEIPSGGLRVKVRCTEIRTDSVIVEVAGARRELRLRTNKPLTE